MESSINVNKEKLGQALEMYLEFSKSETFQQYYQYRTEREKFFKNLYSNVSKEETIAKIIENLWASRVWGNKNYLINSVFEKNGTEKVKEEFHHLLSNETTVEDRYEKFITKIKYLGPSSVTEILCYADPQNAGIWNGVARGTLKWLEVEGIAYEKYHINKHDYANFNNFIKQIVEILKQNGFKNADLLFVDFFFWEVYNKLTVQEEKKESFKIVETEEKLTENQIDYELLSNIIEENSIDVYKNYSLVNPERIKIRDIIDNVSRNEWMLPRFQRYFEWEKENIRGLLEAVFKDYYIGSFLIWKVNRQPEVSIQPIEGVENASTEPDALILDGQQRITSLYYAIKAPNFKVYRSSRLFFYINFYSLFTQLDREDMDIIEAHSKEFTREEQLNKILFPLKELGNHQSWVDELEENLIIKTNETVARNIRRYIDKRLDHLWDGYEIPYIILPKSMEINNVTDIFEGINSSGKPLSVFDLLIARLYKYQINLRDTWDVTLDTHPLINEYYKVISKMPIYILQTMSILYEKNSSASRKDILNIYTNIYEKNERNFEEDWNEIANYVEEAIKRLQNLKDGYGVRTVRDLPFAPMIPVLAALLKEASGRENKGECNERINQWYWSAVFANAYSQGADSQMTIDFREMKKYFENSLEVPRIITQIQRDVNNLYLEEVTTPSGARYRGVLSLIAIEGAKDFDTGLMFENAKDIDKDHIFPRSEGIKGGHKNINSVINMTWMSKETNQKVKKAKLPSIYSKLPTTLRSGF